MTRDEFAKYIFEGEQWTPARLEAVRMAKDGMIPICDVQTFEREVARPDGIIPFRKDEPLHDELTCLRMWADMEAGTFSLSDLS
jgi:hypothetical protein